MPTPASVKLLYDETQNEQIAPWNGKAQCDRKRSGTSVCLCIFVGIVLFLLGLSLGALLHAAIYPTGDSPLNLIGSSSDDNQTDVDTITSKKEIQESEEATDSKEEDDDDDETTTIGGDIEKEDDEEEGDKKKEEEDTADDDQSGDDEEEGDKGENETEKGEDSEEDDKKEDKTGEEPDGEDEEQEKEEVVETKKDESELDDDDENTSEDDEDVVYCTKFPWNDSRLPRHIQPEVYNLTIHPNITTNKLIGSVAIDVKVHKATNLIILHADQLQMTSFNIQQDGEKIEAEFLECEETMQWSFEMDKKVKAGEEFSIFIEYEGKVDNDLVGLYITTHSDSKGRKTHSAVTQFEPSHARRMFPCFDEPSYKAEFQLSVIREPSHVARSNMNIKLSQEHTDGLYIDVFKKSIKMSTYLLAVAILEDYDYVKKTTRNTFDPIEVRLYAPKATIKGQAQFGLNTAIKALEYFENYFNISYPLDKIDLLAVDDFGEGAMENWGLVIFRDSVLLYEEGTTSDLVKEQIALVICHEIAHQWFGNLVTMQWWNDLWLNEGFANYMEYRCVDKIFPEWEIMTRFYVDNVAFSHEPDGLQSSRAIAAPLHKNSKNIMSLFDAISYHKPASVIHMIQTLAGEDNFQRALIEYLNKYKYDNAEGSELWAIVEKHAQMPEGITMNELASSYTTQEGYPYISVSINEDNDVIITNQTRFLFKDGEIDEETSWPIPIYYRTNKQSDTKLQWMKPDQEKVEWNTSETPRWIIANTGGVAFIKVLYDDKLYKELIHQLKHNHEKINAVDRVMLLVDAFDFSKTSLMDIETYMNLVEYAQDEDDRMAWTLISKQLKTIDILIDETPFQNTFQDFQRSLVLKAYEKHAWKEETNRGLEVELIQMACRLRNRDCTKKSINMYNDWILRNKKPRPELQGLILEEGVRQGGSPAWEKALSKYKEATNPTEKHQLISALAATTDNSLITKLLRLCIEKGPFRSNVIPRILAALSNNEVARTPTWRFFRLYYEDFNKKFGQGSSLMVTALRAMVENLSTEHDLQELKEFLKNKKLNTSASKLSQVYEQIELNIQWRTLNEEQLGKWLNSWDDRRRTLYRFRKSARSVHHGRH